MVAQPLNSFICNANDMDFDKVVKSMSDEEELYPGQLYFVLPLSWFNRLLAAEDMASLAVKAGKALMCSSGNKVRCGCCVSKVDPLVFCDEDEMMSSSWSGDAGGDTGNRKGR
ncbi:HTH-type transcriptional regulator protein ptxE, partial [Tanacetum coccineum]